MRRLLATLAIVSIALTSLATTPVQAQQRPTRNDVAGIIAGLAVLGLTAHLIDKQRDRRDDRDKAKRHDRRPVVSRHAPDRHAPRHGWDQRRQWGGHSADRRHDNRRHDYGGGFRGYDRRPAALPASCLSRVQTRNGAVDVLGARCLDRTLRRANRLPGHCATQVYANGRAHPVYDARCLQRQGYQIARY